MRRFLVLLCGLGLALPALAFDAQRAPFAVRAAGERVPYRVFALYVLPGRELTIEVDSPADSGRRFTLVTPAGERAPSSGGRSFRWTAPAEPGLTALAVRRDDGEEIRLNLFVKHPASSVKDGRLKGYRIDAYPAKPLRGLAAYRAPNGFVEVTAENRDTKVSPHFTIGQFLCKQAGGYPKFVVLRPRLLLKLEYLLQRLNERGLAVESFVVMSGFRTPYYNRAIGNVPNSRHVYGGAADIYIDENPADGVMDDLNGDGRITKADATFLYDLIERLAGAKPFEPYRGGLGAYGSTAAHGPFVHVDVRGSRARWGR